MEDKFNQNDFEEFLQEQVRNHRMYPTDAVWREIDEKLHGDKRWPALTICALVLLSATIFICFYFTPKPNIFTLHPVDVSNSGYQSYKSNDILDRLTSSSPFAKDKRNTVFSQNTIVAGSASSNISFNKSCNTSTTTAAVHNKIISNRKAGTLNKTIYNKTAFNNPAFAADQKAFISAAPVISNQQISDNALTAHLLVDENIASKKIAETSVNKDHNDRNMVDEFLKEHTSDVPLHTSPKGRSLKNKLSYQIYIAPSISYRKLLEDYSILKSNNGGPVGLNYVADVNNVVRHKPGTGIEAGFSILYNLSDKVRIKSGFQFNVRQYSIEAYRSGTELASIALVGGNGIDTVNTLTVYRNNNGYYSAELVNRYYQLSIPLGIEWEIVGNKTIQLNVAGSIQPTYLLKRNAYMLSTNFKNYAESPEMVRRWNVNSNIEAFISFKVGDFKWQLGPQLRYQPYSTFIHQYPIKEHLMDYGLKLGVSKIIN